MYPIVASLFAFAVKTGDAILEAKTKIAESTLKATADELLPDLMSNYIALATANVAILTSDYSINAAYITAAPSAVSAYETSIGAGSTGRATQKTQNGNIVTLTKSGSALLKKQGDKIMRGQKSLNPDFYQTYLNARIIIDLGTRHTTIKGIVTDSVTGALLYAAVISLLGTNKSGLSEVNGTYIIQKFKGGVYNITVTLPGYQTLIIPNIEIKLGKSLELNIQLVKI